MNKFYKNITNRLWSLFKEGELAYDDLQYLEDNLAELMTVKSKNILIGNIIDWWIKAPSANWVDVCEVFDIIIDYLTIEEINYILKEVIKENKWLDTLGLPKGCKNYVKVLLKEMGS